MKLLLVLGERKPADKIILFLTRVALGGWQCDRSGD